MLKILNDVLVWYMWPVQKVKARLVHYVSHVFVLMDSKLAFLLPHISSMSQKEYELMETHLLQTSLLNISGKCSMS